VAAFYDKIPGSAPDVESDPGLYTFPCSATLPAVSFTIGGKDLPLPASALIYGPIGNGTFCIGSIIPDDDLASDFWILGYNWMRNYYTIFDYDNSRVGFATLK
jgi:Eukaryotic aspartyl protease